MHCDQALLPRLSVALLQWFSRIRATILPHPYPAAGDLAKSGNSCGCHSSRVCRVGILSPYSGERPGILLNLLQCTGSPWQQGISCPHMSVVLRLRNLALRYPIFSATRSLFTVEYFPLVIPFDFHLNCWKFCLFLSHMTYYSLQNDFFIIPNYWSLIKLFCSWS